MARRAPSTPASAGTRVRYARSARVAAWSASLYCVVFALVVAVAAQLN
jgi:hypothetical protein